MWEEEGGGIGEKGMGSVVEGGMVGGMCVGVGTRNVACCDFSEALGWVKVMDLDNWLMIS